MVSLEPRDAFYVFRMFPCLIYLSNEGIVSLHYIRKIEKERPLNICIRNYANGQFEVERRCTKPRLYKYNNLIDLDGEAAKAEIDLVVSELP